jgi:hypothetical protein
MRPAKVVFAACLGYAGRQCHQIPMERNISATTDASSVLPGKLVNVPYAKYTAPASFFDGGP